MKQEKKLELCFKGDRKYLHGTDMFNEILQFLNEGNVIEVTDIRFSIHQIVDNGLSLYLDAEIDKPVAQMFFKSGNQEHQVYLSRNSSDISCRYEYDEEGIVEKSLLDIEKETIYINGLFGYSYVEVVVACYKHLLEKIFNDVDGKWYFTRMDLEYGFPSQDQSIEITFSKNMNFRLVSGVVKIGDRKIGKIFFTLK